MTNSLLILTIILVLNSRVFAWGGRGHDTICEVAVQLVKDAELKKFLQTRPHIMGHLCNIPDIEWRSLPREITKAGDPTHFIDPEIIGTIPKTTPLDLKKIKEEHTGKQNQFEKDKKIFNVVREMGSVWWRVDQFMREISKLKTPLKESARPQNRAEEQDENLPYNQAVYRFITLAGVMGHYVGDAAQPMHNTADYDGWHAGHGGLHGFYEDAVVGELSGELHSMILKEAQKIKNPAWLKGNTLEKMRTFSQVSFEELPKLFKADPLVKKSEMKKNEQGMSIRKAAERKDASTVVNKMRPMIVSQMARSAKLLAHLWDEAYADLGKPSLKEYKSFKHPFKVDFLAPDYE